MEEEGRRRGDSKTRPRSVSYRRRVSCTGAGGFPTGSSPPLQRDTEKRFFFSVRRKLQQVRTAKVQVQEAETRTQCAHEETF